jgi:replicative DNA helicase
MGQTYADPQLEPYMILAQEIMRRVYSEESASEINAWLMTQVQRLSGVGNESARLTWEESFAYYEGIMAKRAEMAAMPESERKILTWPWATWQNFIDPLDPGMLAVLSAGDGIGKTLYAENIAEHWAKQGMNVVFIHFEVNRALMLDRRTSRHTGIPRRELRLGKLNGQMEAERQRANDRLRDWPGGITYVHTPGWSMDRVLGEVGSLISEGVCDVFVIDYLEKAWASPRQLKQFGSNLYEREANDVEQVKILTEGTGVPALLLAQLNKEGKDQSFADLSRSKIRGSGQKTEKANIVILLHKDKPESELVSVRIDKNTMGACGSFEQHMDAPRFLVVDIENDAPPPPRGRSDRGDGFTF